MTEAEAECIVKDVRLANDNRFEITYKDFIDFMTRRRVNIAFLERGFIDPILASTCTKISTIKDAYEITFERMFEIFCINKTMTPQTVSKEDFVVAVQAMEIKTAIEDLNELFNYIDQNAVNRITKA